MLSEIMFQALNEQFTKERQNEAIYRSNSDALKNIAWDGFAAFCAKQADGEAQHARLFANYLIDAGYAPVYSALDAVLDVAHTPLGVFSMLLTLEHQTTSQIKTLYYLAESQEDPQTCVFLHPLLIEQVEEEKLLADAVTELTRATDNASLLLLDARYGS